jgi:hypothetical protein
LDERILHRRVPRNGVLWRPRHGPWRRRHRRVLASSGDSDHPGAAPFINYPMNFRLPEIRHQPLDRLWPITMMSSFWTIPCDTPCLLF